MNTSNSQLSQELNAESFLLTHFELHGPTCSVKKKDVEGTSEGDSIQKGDANGVEIPWVEPRLLNFKAKYKQRVSRLLDRFAVRRGPTYCFTEENYKRFASEFNSIKSEFDDEALEFSEKLDEHVASYISKKPHLKEFILRHKLSKSDIRNRFRFEMAVPTALQAHDEAQQDELVKEVEAGFWKQIADRSKELLQSLSGREYGTQKSLGPVRDLAALMFNNSSLSDRVSEVANEVWAFVEDLPKFGKVEGSEFTDVVRYLGVLASGECEQAFRENRMPVLAKPSQESNLDEDEDDSAVSMQEPAGAVLVQPEEADVSSEEQPSSTSLEKQEDNQVVTPFSPFAGGVNTLF